MAINTRRYNRRRTYRRRVPYASYNRVSGRGGYSLSRAKTYLMNNYRKPYRYPGAGARIGEAAGGFVGRRFPRIGGKEGAYIGKKLGQGAHSLIKTVTGFGDYNVRKNSLVYNSDAVPEFSVNNERCTMITHREFIADITSSITFNNTEYRINPSVEATFPWLSAIAKNYEQYVVQGMIFEFKTLSATAIGSTNTALGSVVMATQYNSLAAEFNSKQQMENYEFAQSSVPSQSILHAIECDPEQTQCGGIFNVYDPGSSSGDIRLYDIGRFNIATVGMQAADVVIGELWVSYKICLLKPRLVAIDTVFDFWNLDAATVGVSQPLGDTALAIAAESNTGVVTLNGTGEVIISSSFIGFLMIEATYVISGTNPHNFAPPTVALLSPSLIDKTGNYLGVASAANSQNYFTAGGFTGTNQVYTSQVFLQCLGGKDADGNNPSFVFSTMTAGNLSIDAANVIAMSYYGF